MALVLSVLVQHVPTYSSLGYIENRYATFSYLHTRNEECSYWEWPGLTGERTNFSSTWMCDGWWLKCWPFCHPYPHSRCEGYNPSQFAALWLYLLHYRNYLPLGIVNIGQHAYVSLVPPQYCCQVSPGSYANVSPFQFCCLRSCGMPLLFGLTVPQQ